MEMRLAWKSNIIRSFKNASFNVILHMINIDNNLKSQKHN